MTANYALNSLHVPQGVRVRSFAFNYLAILTAKTLRALKAMILDEIEPAWQVFYELLNRTNGYAAEKTAFRVVSHSQINPN